MIIVLAVSSLSLLGLPCVLRRLARRLPPAEWAQLNVVLLVFGAVTFETALVLLAAPTVLRALGVPALADLCQQMLGDLVPGGPVVGWWAAGSALAIPLIGGHGALRARRTQRGLHVESLIGRHEHLGEHELVVLPSDQVFAFSLTGSRRRQGRRSQVIVSERLVRELPPEELDTVLRHEIAHIEAHHQRYLILITTLEHGLVLLPFLRRSTATLRGALERWADERAAGADPEGRATLRAALLHVTRAMVAPPVAAFSSADTVLERMQAMEEPPAVGSGLVSLWLQRALVYAPALLLGAVTVMSLGLWLDEAHLVLATMGFCPI